MDQKNTGLIMIILAVLLTILQLLTGQAFILYIFWIAVIVIFLYGLYLFLKK